MKNQRRIELVVGAFVLVGLLILMYLIFTMGEDLFTPRYDLTAYFRNAAGLSPGVTVTLAGVPVGKVKSVRLLTPPEVEKLGRSGTVIEVVLSIDQKFRIPADSELVLFRTAILGEQKLMFEESDSDEFLAADGTGVVEFTRLPPSPTDELGTIVDAFRRDFSELVDNINAVLGDEQFQAHVKATAANVAEATGEARLLARSANQAAESVDRAMTSAEALLCGEDVKLLIGRARSVAESLDDGLSAKSVERITENAGSSAEELRKLLEKLNISIDRGQGALAALLTDEQLGSDVREGIKALRQSAVGFRDAIGRITSTVDEIRRLSEYIRRNPTALIWGRGEPGPGYPRPSVGPPGAIH